MSLTPTPAGADAQKSPAARVADFAASEMFRNLFREGMDLVEETAAYLDGPGREDAKRLGRSGALSYAAESMALTTRLMQSASWLLTQRAVAEGEMSPIEAAEEKYRLAADKPARSAWPAGEDACPPMLADLVTRSRALYGRLERLDAELFRSGPGVAAPGVNPLADQWSALESAFGRDETAG